MCIYHHQTLINAFISKSIIYYKPLRESNPKSITIISIHQQTIKTMDKSSINVFQVKIAIKQLPFKLSAGDVFNEFLYLGDQKGNMYAYPIRAGDPEVIPKNVQENAKPVTKSKIDKILAYKPLSLLIVLSDEKLFAVDPSIKRIQPIAQKVHDFAINQPMQKDAGLYSIAVVSRKKQGFILFYNPTTKKFQQSKAKFQINELPNAVGYTGSYINLAYKKDYESLNIEKSFAVKKGPLQAKSPFLKVTGDNQVLYFSDQIGIFMTPEFMPKQKDNIFVNRPIINITQCGNYCIIMCEGLLQVYSTFDQKKFNLIQEIPFNNVKGITSERPFVFGREELFYLYEIPYQVQIKALLEKGRVDDAIYLLVQNSGEDEKKIEQIKMDAVWPLIKKMQFSKAKQLLTDIEFDIRELIMLFPEYISIQIQAMTLSKPDKSMSTMIIEFLSDKPNKTKEEQTELKRKAKLFLKDVLQAKRQYYAEKSQGSKEMNKVKIRFNVSKYSLIKPRLQDATVENLLEVIDFTLIKWFLDMSYFRQLQEFFLNNPIIFCKNLFEEIQNSIKNNAKLVEFPTLKPRLYTAFDRVEQAYEGWKVVAQNNPKENLVKIACEQAVKLLASFDNKKGGILKKLSWVLKRNPEVAMNFFKMVDLNSISPDEIIRQFEDQGEIKYLEMFLEIIVYSKKTEIQAYHTKLLSLYIDNLFKLCSKEAKQESKELEFQQKITKMRKLLKSPEAKYASQPILRKIQNCQWLMQDQIFLYSRQKRHEDALKKYIKKNMNAEAEKYCRQNRDKTLTLYFKMLLKMYNYFEQSNNSGALLLKKDILMFLKKYSSDSELDPLIVLQLIPDNWMLNDNQGVGAIYQFMQSAIIHTLHEKRTAYTSKHLSEMDLLTSEYNLIEAKRAYLKFTYKKKCLKCDLPIADKFFVVYPNANVFHQSCAKGLPNTICPKTNQDFQKTFKY